MLNTSDKEELKKQVLVIQDIANNRYADKLKKQAKNNTRNALIGGAVGIILAIASRKNIYAGGIIGLIVGGIVLTKKN